MAVVRSIRTLVGQLFSSRFATKAGFLEPVDWRAREWNKGADFLAGHAISTRSCGGNLGSWSLRNMQGQAFALQFFSDGGYVPGVGGGFGVQLFAFRIMQDGHLERSLLGYTFNFDANARSAFDMELQGLRAGLQILQKSLNKRTHHPHVISLAT